MANQRGRNEGIRVLEDFVCRAITEPSLIAPDTQASQLGRAVNPGVQLHEDAPTELTPREPEERK